MERFQILFLVLLLLDGIFYAVPKDQQVHKNAQKIIRKNQEHNNNAKNNGDEKPKQSEKKIRDLGPVSLQFLKKKTENKIKDFQKKLNASKDLSAKEREFKHNLLVMFLEELSESEKDMLEAQEALKNSLSTDFLDSKTLLKNSKQRLDALRLATMKEEQSFLRIQTIEKAIENHMAHGNETSLSLMDELLQDIAKAADQLEVEMDDHIMEENAMVGGDHIEAVLHMKEGDKQVKDMDADFDPGFGDERLDVLVDSQNNKFILSRPKDMTSSYIDHLFVLDLMLIWIISFPLSLLCHILSIPSMFGYVMAGLFLGPSGVNVINSMVQFESFGEFGVFLIMFVAGLEFSPEKLRKYWKVALQAPVLIMMFMITAGLLISSILNSDIPKGESVFIASCLSLSSTPLVTKYLQGNSDTGDYASILLGILIMQDIQLSLIVAILPTIAASQSSTNVQNIIGTLVISLGHITISIVIMIVGMVIAAKYLINPFAQYVGNFPKEVVVLATFAIMFLMQLLTHALGVSMELGCFLSGVLFGMTTLRTQVESITASFHDLFSVIFFATVGLHVFPTFVVTELTTLIWLTIFVVGGKYIISMIVLQLLLPKNIAHYRDLVSSGLAQVSEFSFVISSRARHLKILSREVYLLILSITTLSIAMSPLLWKLSWWRYKRRSNAAILHTKA